MRALLLLWGTAFLWLPAPLAQASDGHHWAAPYPRGPDQYPGILGLWSPSEIYRQNETPECGPCDGLLSWWVGSGSLFHQFSDPAQIAGQLPDFAQWAQMCNGLRQSHDGGTFARELAPEPGLPSARRTWRKWVLLKPERVLVAEEIEQALNGVNQLFDPFQPQCELNGQTYANGAYKVRGRFDFFQGLARFVNWVWIPEWILLESLMPEMEAWVREFETNPTLYPNWNHMPGHEAATFLLTHMLLDEGLALATSTWELLHDVLAAVYFVHLSIEAASGHTEIQRMVHLENVMALNLETGNFEYLQPLPGGAGIPRQDLPWPRGFVVVSDILCQATKKCNWLPTETATWGRLKHGFAPE